MTTPNNNPPTPYLAMIPLYYVIPIANDGNTLATTPRPMPICEVSEHMEAWRKQFKHQGYFFNCKQERVPLFQLSLLVVTEEAYKGDCFCR